MSKLVKLPMAIRIIAAAVIGFVKFRTKSEESKKSDGNRFARIELEREKKGKKNKKMKACICKIID